ncbi:hypothetical protein BIU82_06030 [Arthrobacter sp. SW1]|uniref:tyrosine-protein phosphatase n=1 Tax=Arthrobacter sp. SW1 TaxID=1920889 RepID=UPI000877DD41|nr:tyrosine-protein phosphatase [Arthrobacter sp. SW1]OFI38060.1 hypothetical protein BIU82_06030 [Arthrobacter sp. SW1]
MYTKLFSALLAALIGLSFTAVSAAPATARTTSQAPSSSTTLDGASNFRDVSAMVSRLRSGVLYRSNKLSKLSDADLIRLQALNLKTDVDLRTASERTSEPDRIPAGVWYETADVSGNLASEGLTTFESESAAEQFMIQTYRDFIRKDSANLAYRKLFLLAAGASADSSLLFHCTAGKDRTGWGTAILLLAAGVSFDDVVRDYLASNDYLAEENARTLAAVPAGQQETVKPILDVRLKYLQAAWDEMTARYGSFDAYLHQGLGLSEENIKQLRQTLRG